MLCTSIFARGQNLDRIFLLLHCIDLMTADIFAKFLCKARDEGYRTESGEIESHVTLGESSTRQQSDV